MIGIEAGTDFGFYHLGEFLREFDVHKVIVGQGLESHIVSNSKKADSIVLSAGAEISGDLRSTGGIQADGRPGR